jgi:hypothetical protein
MAAVNPEKNSQLVPSGNAAANSFRLASPHTICLLAASSSALRRNCTKVGARALGMAGTAVLNFLPKALIHGSLASSLDTLKRQIRFGAYSRVGKDMGEQT